MCVVKRLSGRRRALRLVRDGKEILILDAHSAPTFRAAGDVLFFVQPRSVSAGEIRAYSLLDGRTLWKTRLKEVEGPMSDKFNSIYPTRVTLDLSPNTVIVMGSDICGDYTEIFHRTTGWRLAHRIYGAPRLEWKIE